MVKYSGWDKKKTFVTCESYSFLPTFRDSFAAFLMQTNNNNKKNVKIQHINYGIVLPLNFTTGFNKVISVSGLKNWDQYKKHTTQTMKCSEGINKH